jgi:hypothetical protein
VCLNASRSIKNSRVFDDNQMLNLPIVKAITWNCHTVIIYIYRKLFQMAMLIMYIYRKYVSNEVVDDATSILVLCP